MTPLDVISGTLVLVGAAFGVVGAIGIHRFPDVFTRMHAAGVTDTLCALLILAGLAVQAGLTLVAGKLFLILLFLWFTSPTATHALAKAALRGGIKPELNEREASSSKV